MDSDQVLLDGKEQQVGLLIMGFAPVAKSA